MKNNLIVSEQHWTNTFNLRVKEVNHALRVRPERLYVPSKHEPKECLCVLVDNVPDDQNSFQSMEDMLNAVRKWCE